MKLTAKIISKCTIACMIWLCASFAAVADDRFIEGFPDIPYLDILAAVVGEPVIFDTASGTVAEVGLQFSEPVATVLTIYSQALVGLGWQCTNTDAYLRCTREQSVIQLTAPNGKNVTAPFILRLEPRQ